MAKCCSLQVIVVTPCFASTKYHFPTRMSVDKSQPGRFHSGSGQETHTFVYHYSNMVWNVVFSNINNKITGV